jgi:hypothetical protein
MFKSKRKTEAAAGHTQRELNEIRLKEFGRLYATWSGTSLEFEDWVMVGKILLRTEIEHEDTVTPEERRMFFEKYPGGVGAMAKMLEVIRQGEASPPVGKRMAN